MSNEYGAGGGMRMKGAIFLIGHDSVTELIKPSHDLHVYIVPFFTISFLLGFIPENVFM
jgi:hypothetical protein